MDLPRPVVLPRPIDDLSSDLAEADAAIELVRSGAAERVRLVALSDPLRVASLVVARAQAAHVDFTTQREGRSLTLTFGPRL